MPPAAKSDFLNKFKDRISVVGRDGTVTKVPNGDAPSVTDSNASCALSVDDSTEEMGAITRMHPALANALLGDVSSSMEVPMGFGMPSPQRSSPKQRVASGPTLGSFGPPPGQQTVVQPPPSQITIVPPQSGHAGQLQGVAEQHAQQAARRTIKGKPSISELQALAEQESVRFGLNSGGRPTVAGPISSLNNPTQRSLAAGGGSIGYKPYTGKVSTEYQVLGRLKPDLNTEELNSKRANLERVKMFSRNLKIINTEDLQAQAQARAEREKEKQPAPKELTKAQKAREYAKQDDGDDALAQLERQHAEHVRQAALIRAELGL